MMYILCTVARNELRRRKKIFLMSFPLLSLILGTRRFIMQRIRILFVGFIFLNASSLSVFRCICKFTGLLTFISHELKGFFQAQLSTRGDI